MRDNRGAKSPMSAQVFERVRSHSDVKVEDDSSAILRKLELSSYEFGDEIKTSEDWKLLVKPFVRLTRISLAQAHVGLFAVKMETDS